MKFEKEQFDLNNSLPEKNTLPLNVKKSEILAKHGESTVHDTKLKTQDGQDKRIALKQIHKEKFATLEEMKIDRQFYESLKNSPLGKFVPDTLHFIAQVTPDEPVQGFRVQQFIEGKTIDMVSDEELYQDPEVVKQLMELTNAAIPMLKAAREEKSFQPDFRRPLAGRDIRAIIGGLISEPRYSKNIIIAAEPGKNGQRVFFVDTGINAAERTVKREEMIARHIANPLAQMHFIRWKKKLKKILEKLPSPNQTVESTKFSEQWQNPEQVDVNRESISVYDIKPESQKTEVPVVFMPGFGGTPLMFKKDIDTLVQSGRRVISIDAPHGVEHKLAPEERPGIPDAGARKIAALIETLNAKGIEKVAGVGNSEGSLTLVLAAVLYPEKFESLVLENTPGLIGDDTTLNLAARYLKDIIKSKIEGLRKKIQRPKHSTAASKNNSADLSLENLYHAIQEIRAMAKTQILEFLREITHKGVGISIIHGADDNAFPMERVQQMVKANMIDGFYSVKGKHAEVRPETERNAYAELAEYALAAMEKRKQ